MTDPRDNTEMDDDCWTENDQRVSEALQEWNDNEKSLEDTTAIIKENIVEEDRGSGR